MLFTAPYTDWPTCTVHGVHLHSQQVDIANVYESTQLAGRTQSDQHSTAATKLYHTTTATKTRPMCGGYPREELVQITDMTPSSTDKGEEWHSTESRQEGER